VPTPFGYAQRSHCRVDVRGFDYSVGIAADLDK
jgi:hypothetical protein